MFMDWRSKMTLNKIIEKLKKENPVIQEGSDEAGYTILESDQYEAKIQQWAEIIESKIEADKIIADKKANVLERLGITEEEAKLLLS